MKNNYHRDVCYKNVSVQCTGSRWVRILELNVEPSYLNSSFSVLNLLPFFLHWTYWWGILVSSMRSQCGVLWFLSPPPALSCPLPSTFWRKIMSGISYGKSPQIVTCASEVLESVTVFETFLVPLYPQYFSPPARQMQSAISWSRFGSFPNLPVTQRTKHLGKNNTQKSRVRFWCAFKPCFMWISLNLDLNFRALFGVNRML